MPKLTIDDIEVTVEPGTSLLQAAEQLGIEIPRFCYHDKLSVPANCRMCLVEVEGAPKLAASCAMPCGDNMKVKTGSEKVRRARQGMMEFLLINHPLDCPICDQGGECDLQDQAVAYGFDRSRFEEDKRAVKDKELGPVVKTVMTRCIHCTRCVRFGDEVAGTQELGVLNRGEHLEIGTYVEQMMTSELSGNLVDVCPVGALTAKPYEFIARPWELVKTESIDALDAVGSNIRIDCRGNQIMRVLPRLHEDVNEEWISDKTRHACDGLRVNRLDRPYVRDAKGKLKPASWTDAFETVAERLKGVDGRKIAAVTGDLCDVESMMALKDLMTGLGSPHLECRQDGAKFDPYQVCGYGFNTTIAGVEEADAILLIGTNPRWEAAMLNARIHKNWRAKNTKIGLIGPHANLNYEYTHLGTGSDALEDLLNGKHSFASILEKAEKPMLILGMGAVRRDDGLGVHAMARAVAEKFGMVRDDWNGFNLLHLAAARMGALSIGFVPDQARGGLDMDGIIAASKKGDIEVLYALGADELPYDRLGKKTFVIYQGHHGDVGAARADVIFPGAAYTEKSGLYVNLEGRVQTARKAAFPPGDAREDWTILRALSSHMGYPLPYDHPAELRARLIQENEIFDHIDQIPHAAWKNFAADAGDVKKLPFRLPVANFYKTCPVSRASVTMQECTDAFVDKTMEKKRANA
ncbi:MAG: NADH-quinone oxidoreductase subunit G [Alphaproteobacteria bacterium]|nr:MAG: NADH-quinone oxidoreductase subunit G [Alphaproteobacteria bacterium]